MLWLLVLILIGGLSFVIFHKPQVNPMGAGWTPPAQRRPELPIVKTRVDGSNHDVQTSVEDMVTVPVVKQMPDTFNFNDLFGGPKNQSPTDRPNA